MDNNIDINLSENEIILSDNELESDSSDDSDEEFDYLNNISNYVKTSNSLAKDMIKHLYINNKLNKINYIQKSLKDENEVKISHIVLNDSKLQKHQFSDSNYIFESNKKHFEDLERESIYDENNGKNMTKSDVQINVIPNTFLDFLNIILELDANLIKDQKSKLYFREETQYRNIQYKDHNSYVNSFIPSIIRKLWKSLKDNRKRELSTNLLDFKLIEGEIKCFQIRNNSLTESEYKFGQIVVLNHLIDNNNEQKMFFGIVKSIESKLIDKNSEHSFDLSEYDSHENEFILDEITLFCKPFSQNCGKVSVMALNCIQNYLLEARIVYELEEKYEQYFKQILKPIFTFGVTGISIEMETRTHIKFFDDQKDSIQKAYEVCCSSDLDSSNFVVIYGPEKSGKTEVLRETILQLIKLGEINVNKLIVISNNLDEINSIIDQLKRHKIKVYHIDSEGKCLSHNKKEIMAEMIKLNKKNIKFQELVDKEMDSYSQCLKFYGEEIELNDMSIKDKFVKEKIDKRVINHLLSESNVIIGSISSLCNNEEFNITYNFGERVDVSVLIDNADKYTEPQILSLLYAGVKGFVLFGNNSENENSSENCESFLQRYVRLYNNSYKSQLRSSSVVRLYDSIESRKRLEEIKNKRNNFTYNRNKSYNYNNIRGKSYKSFSSNRGYNKYPMNSNKRFINPNSNIKNRRNFTHKYMDNKDNIRPFIQTNQTPSLPKHEITVISVPNDLNHYQNNVMPNEGFVDLTQFQNNVMITDQMLNLSQATAYGNRESYVNQSNNTLTSSNFDYNQINLNETQLPLFVNITQFTPESNLQFMPNPSSDNNQHFNYGQFIKDF